MCPVPLSIFCWTRFETLFEKISRSFQLLSSITLQELGEIRVPDVEHVGPLEHGDALLVGLERLLKVVVLFEEQAVVDDDLWSGDFEFEDPVVHGLGGLERSEALLQIGVQ